jgi:hypothetical protein
MKRKTKTTNTSLLSESVSCSNLKFDNSMDIVIVCYCWKSSLGLGQPQKCSVVEPVFGIPFPPLTIESTTPIQI